jgi:hypothetical protein
MESMHNRYKGSSHRQVPDIKGPSNMLIKHNSFWKKLILISNFPNTSGSVYLPHENKVIEQNIHKILCSSLFQLIINALKKLPHKG